MGEGANFGVKFGENFGNFVSSFATFFGNFVQQKGGANQPPIFPRSIARQTQK